MNEEITLGLLDEKSTVRRLPGQYRGLDGAGRVLVDINEGRVPAYSFVGYIPEMNESVWVEIVDGVAYMHGPTVPKPAKGVVATTGTGTCTVTTTTGVVTASVASGVTLTVGQTVKLYWAEGAHVLGVIPSPTAPATPDAPSSASKRTTVTFTAIDSGSYGTNWWTNDIWATLSNKSAWFYGSKIRDTIPDDAVIKSAQIYLPPPKRLLGDRPFGRHTHSTKPAGAPNITNTSTLPGTSGWVSIPTSHIDFLKTSFGGLGFDPGDWNIWPGTQDPRWGGVSGSLRVTYES